MYAYLTASARASDASLYSRRPLSALGRRLARLRGFADFEGVRSLFINEIDEKVFTTSGGAGDGGSGDFGRWLGRQFEPELLDQQLEFRFGLGVAGQ